MISAPIRTKMLGMVAAFAVLCGCHRTDVYPLTPSSIVDGGDPTSIVDAKVEWALYVAPNGDDSNPGTLAQPVRTLDRARALVRTRNARMGADIAVYLRGGTYPLAATLEFSEADSGTGGHYVKYLAYPGERPLLTGGRPIRGWALTDAATGVYSATVGGPAFRQLYVNGAKAVRARAPNLGANGAANFYRLSGFDAAARTVQFPEAYGAGLGRAPRLEMHVMTAWADNTLRVAQISTTGSTSSAKFLPPEDGLLFVRPNPRLDQQGWGAGRVFYFENARELLDQPGEWYLDEDTGVVHYKPRAGEDMATATVVAPAVETLVRVAGSSTASQASYLWFQGVAFAHSSYLRPSQFGFLDPQAGQYNLTAQANNNQTIGRPAAGVTVLNAHHIRFERNVFAQMAATGLDFVAGDQQCVVAGNVFTQIGGNGLSVGKFVADDVTEYHTPYNPTDKNEICTNIVVQNNFINGVGTEIQGACGIAGGYPRYLSIEHNEVTGSNFTGISVGYGWTSAPNAMSNNRINHNHIHRVATLLAGGAAITAISNQGTASEMQYNYLHDIRTSPWADYAAMGLHLDEGTSGYTVAHNVMIDTPGTLTSPRAGSNLVMDNGENPTGAADTIATAGIEPAYVDIKASTLPPVEF